MFDGKFALSMLKCLYYQLQMTGSQDYVDQISEMTCSLIFSSTNVLKHVLEVSQGPGLGSSGRLAGFISNYPGTSPTVWCQVMATTNFWRESFFPGTVGLYQVL